MSPRDVVIWHDVECGRYEADLAFWRELASTYGGPVLDVGAGTGRVTLDLAAYGHDVVALDVEPALLAELERRAGALPNVRTVVADARAFALEERDFPLIVVPMQTIQLLGPKGRRSFLRAARAHVAPRGLVAVALADEFETFEAAEVLLPVPDRAVVDGVLYSSQPVAIREEGKRIAIERVRETLNGDAQRSTSRDVLHLDRLDAARTEAEARAAGFEPLPARWIPPTDEHIGTIVVMLRG